MVLKRMALKQAGARARVRETLKRAFLRADCITSPESADMSVSVARGRYSVLADEPLNSGLS